MLARVSTSSLSGMSSSSSLSCARLSIWITVAVLLQIIGLSLFVLGFFPVKPTLSGVSGPESYRAPMCNSIEDHIEMNQLQPDQRRSLYQEMSEILPLFDRLILMVVDGLPAEFVLGKGDQPPTKSMIQAMPYTQSLLASGTAIGYCAKAAPPTVTMPRLKAMVSGAIGGFLDVAFNFNTQAFLDDNLLGQLYDIGWKMVMLGDETWIKLFPTFFARHDGVSSFYVKDTVEVDHNVSRHLGAELVTNDWNLLILHYLGLDHVGHIGGRNSILMIPKMKEMDEVIKTIHMSSVQHKDHPRTLLVVVSDHGMTDTGNHGGSSYEETDSLALFIGLESKLPESEHMTCNTAFQVDIAPTLALHFGVPIPKNNVGVLMAETFDSLTDGQKLRILELNSWQLLRLLQAQLPDLLCDNFACSDYSDAKSLGSSATKGRIEEKFHCLFSKAASLHSSWTSQKGRNSRFNSSGNFRETVAAYNEFLKIASEWLSRRATDVSMSPNGFPGDKPPELLAPGIAILLVSCVTLLSILFRLRKEVYLSEEQCVLDSNNCGYMWHLDETFVLLVIMILVFSMGSSSMVEEEQYIWHFLTSTLFFLFLRKSIQESPARAAPSLVKVVKGQNYNNYSRSCAIILVLICGRLLRGWHQGGVNWVHLPDISKWLEQSGPHTIKSIQIFSALLIISLSSFALHLLRLKRVFGLVVQVSLFISGLLVVMHIMEYEDHTFMPSGNSSTSIAQIVYGLFSMIVMVSLLQAPWTMPISVGETHVKSEPRLMTSLYIDVETKSPLAGLRFSLYLIGWTYIICWCLLQLLLQQPINAMPILLLLLQFLASMLYFSVGGTHHKQWVEVAALYFLGMSGHFSLGNSNTLATIDVAGAFIGISSHSTILSGIIMFIITFASPLLSLLSLVIYASTKDISYLLVSRNENFGHLLQVMIGFPCVVPLALNSVTLTSFTVILLLMRNHLFVWSVFSPKYLYVFATTICVYIGVLILATSGIYACSVFFFRKGMLTSKRNGKRTKSR